VPDDKSSVEKALDLCVYAPVGAALYVRDMLPGMLGIFVSRGKRELSGKVSPAPPPPPPAPAEVKRRIDESVGAARVVAESGFGVAKDVAGAGIGVARDVAGSALKGLLDARASAPVPEVPVSEVQVAEVQVAEVQVPEVQEDAPRAAAPTPSVPPAPADDLTVPGVDELPIRDYDELSASQVVERLDGLDAAALEAVRRYESAHRGRNTILAKIAQLG
jgi:hypothetical protein